MGAFSLKKNARSFFTNKRNLRSKTISAFISIQISGSEKVLPGDSVPTPWPGGLRPSAKPRRNRPYAHTRNFASGTNDHWPLSAGRFLTAIKLQPGFLRIPRRKPIPHSSTPQNQSFSLVALQEVQPLRAVQAGQRKLAIKYTPNSGMLRYGLGS